MSQLFRSLSKLSKRIIEMGPLQQQIEKTLTEQLKPVHIRVINESPLHNAPPGAESHFKVIIVSEEFTNKSHIQRHRLIYSSLKEEMPSIHALSITAKSPEQWKSNPIIESSPSCSGGHS